MIQYPDLDKPASNYNYPPPPDDVFVAGVPYQMIPPTSQYPPLPITVFPDALAQQTRQQKYDKKRMPPYPLDIRCPECQGYITTKITYIPGCLSYGLCLSLCFVGLFCGCCLIPLCAKPCQKEVHQCPLCESIIGRVR